MRPLRITYLHQYFNTPDMAGSTRSFEMARRLVSAGHDVHMVTTWREETKDAGWFMTQEAGINVHWLPLPYSNHMSFGQRIRAFVRFAWAAARKAASLEADVLFATSTPLTIALPGIWASRRKRIPMVFEVRDMWPDVPIALGVLRNRLLIKLARSLERTAYKRSSRIVALAPGMREDIIAKGVPAEYVSVIPNGCDLELSNGRSGNQDPRAMYSWLSDRPMLLYAGAIGKANGVDYLVHVAGKLAELNPAVCVVVIGDGKERSRVNDLAASLGVSGKNFFLLDQLPKKDLAGWLRAADIHVALMRGPASYTRDAVNNKFFDALACGKPIANNFSGWQATIAEENGVGIALDPNDAVASARRIVEALKDKDWLAAVPSRTRNLATGRFSRDSQAADLERILVEAVNGTGVSH
jgi:glycosyltransferase involved in cell wall biosynthesis